MSDQPIYRVPMSDDQLQAILEAMIDIGDPFVQRGLLQLALSFRESVKEDLLWRLEDEA